MILKKIPERVTAKYEAVYLSIPMGVSWTNVEKVINLLLGCGITVYYWGRGTEYSPHEFDNLLTGNITGVVAFTTDNSFKLPLTDMTRGSRTEIEKAHIAGIPLYGVYTTKDSKSPYIYDAHVHINPVTYIKLFSSIAGTANSILSKTGNTLKISNNPGNQLISEQFEADPRWAMGGLGIQSDGSNKDYVEEVVARRSKNSESKRNQRAQYPLLPSDCYPIYYDQRILLLL